MKNVLKTVLFLATVLFLGSCAKDKGNYDYKEINRVQVSTKDTVFTVQQLQEISISPTIVETLPSKDEYEYSWIAYPVYSTVVETIVGDQEKEAVLLSSEKNLKEVITLSPMEYYLQYTVTNKANGIKTFKRYSLTVVGAFYEGWLVLQNKANIAQLSFIRKDDQLFMDPIKQINDISLKGKALRAYASVIYRMSQINLYTDEGSYRFEANDFSLVAEDADMYLTKIDLKDPFHSVNHINSDQYLINDGNVYATIAPNFGVPGKYSTAFAGEVGYIYPYLFCGNRYYGSFYDNKNMRFVHADYNSRFLLAFSSTLPGAYNVTNVGKTMIAADLGYNNVYYTVMKDANGLYFYAYNPNLAAPAELSQPILASPDIEKATAFAASSLLQHMYYVAENKIYLYDIPANSSRKVYEFPAGKVIKDIQMYKPKRWSPANETLYNKRLVVATNEGQSGEVYYFDLSPTGDISKNTYSMVFKGFGEIVQLNYRNPNLD